MATYNGEKYIREQLDSILKQSIQDFELVIADDNSSDRTFYILKEYAKNDTRIKIYKNDKNIGFIKNFEKAISLCSGEYIALSDQDDIWFLNHLEILKKNIKDNFLICADAELYNGSPLSTLMSETLSLDYIPKENIFFYLLFNNFVQGAAMMINRKLLKFITNFSDNQGFFHDHVLALYAAYYEKLNYINLPIMYYRQHNGTVTQNKKKSFFNFLCKARNKMLFKYRKDFLQNFHRQELNKYNSILDKAIKFYSRNRFYKILFLIKNYKKMYSVKNNKYLFFRVVKTFLGA